MSWGTQKRTGQETLVSEFYIPPEKSQEDDRPSREDALYQVLLRYAEAEGHPPRLAQMFAHQATAQFMRAVMRKP